MEGETGKGQDKRRTETEDIEAKEVRQGKDKEADGDNMRSKERREDNGASGEACQPTLLEHTTHGVPPGGSANSTH